MDDDIKQYLKLLTEQVITTVEGIYKCKECGSTDIEVVSDMFVLTSYPSQHYTAFNCKQCGYSIRYEDREISTLRSNSAPNRVNTILVMAKELGIDIDTHVEYDIVL